MQSDDACACFVRVGRFCLGSILGSILESFCEPGGHYTHVGVTFSGDLCFMGLGAWPGASGEVGTRAPPLPTTVPPPPLIQDDGKHAISLIEVA